MNKFTTYLGSFLLVTLMTSVTIPASAQAIDQIADRMEIAEVIAKYSYAADFSDPDAFAALFVEDGIFEFYIRDAKEPFERRVSREVIRAKQESRKESKRISGIKTGHHQSGLIFIELTADTARTQTMLVHTVQGADETAPKITSSGVYYDSWRKTSEGWRIAQRVIRLDGPLPGK